MAKILHRSDLPLTRKSWLRRPEFTVNRPEWLPISDKSFETRIRLINDSMPFLFNLLFSIFCCFAWVLLVVTRQFLLASSSEDEDGYPILMNEKVQKVQYAIMSIVVLEIVYFVYGFFVTRRATRKFRELGRAWSNTDMSWSIEVSFGLWETVGCIRVMQFDQDVDYVQVKMSKS